MGLTNGSANRHLLWGGGGLCVLKFYDFQSLRGLDMGKEGRGQVGQGALILHPSGVQSLGAAVVERELLCGAVGTRENRAFKHLGGIC